MKKILKNSQIRNYIIILIFLTCLEFMFRLEGKMNTFSLSFIRIFIDINILSLIISYIVSLFKDKVANIIIIVLSVIFTIYAFLQLGFNDFIGVYASFNQSTQLGAVTEYIKDFFFSFNPWYYFMFLPLIGLIIYYIYRNKHIIIDDLYKTKFVKRTFVTLVTLCISIALYYATLCIPFLQPQLQVITNKELIKHPTHPSLVVNQFGIIGFGVLDIKSIFDGDMGKIIYEENKKEQIEKIKTYLDEQPESHTNEYTGYFENKNVIVIMMESVSDIFINKKLYPNFYKIYNEGWSFTNNYSPRNSCSTGNNEFSAITSLYTIQNNCTANVYKENSYYESLFNLFNNKGYSTSSMHNYDDKYYSRTVIHPNLGSGRYYSAIDLEIEYDTKNENWSSDEDLINKAMDITLNSSLEKPFMLWLTTVTSHQPYGISSTDGDKYLDLFKKDNYPIDLQRYMSKLKTVDNALGILLNRLKSAKMLEDTVIVLFGDHYPYALKNETINLVLDYNLADYEIERTPLVIYNSETPKMEVDKYTSYINLTPTIANLFNLDYNAKLYMGSDVLDDNYLDIVTFADGSWKNASMYYNAATANAKYYTEEKMDKEEIIRINNLIANKMQMSKMIIENNYFAYPVVKNTTDEIEEVID